MTVIDALFISVSAVSVTGLSAVTISDTFNTAGIIVLALVLQLGGLRHYGAWYIRLDYYREKIGLQQRKINYGRP